MINPQELKKLQNYLKSADRTLIITHSNPDGDAIGSSLGLYQGLKSIGINVEVACIDGVPENFKFVKGSKDMKTEFRLKDYDGVIWVDCGDKRMPRFHDTIPELFEDSTFKINIDHHPSNDEFGNINFQHNDVSSACEIVFRLLEDLEIKISEDIATALILGLYTDTGGFTHQNTQPSTFKNAGDLIKYGANTKKIASEVFKKYDFKTLKLWSKVLKDLYVTKDEAAIVGVHRNDYESIGCTRNDVAGVIDYVNSIEGIKYSVMLSEDEKGNVKASLRTRDDDMDVKEIAEKFGGGGHVKASGFTIPGGHLEKEVKWKIVKE